METTEKLIDLKGLNIFKEQFKNKIALSYDTSTKHINIKFGTEILDFIDATPFILDGMLNTVTLVDTDNEGKTGLFIKFVFNTDAAKTDIYIDVADFLKDVFDKIDEIFEALDTKVDKESGKGLSTNDFNNEYKEMLDNIATESDIISLFA